MPLTTVKNISSGTILPHGSSTVPNGYLSCDGSAINRTTYADLYAVIGTSWGSGDGSSTFNVPDLRAATTDSIRAIMLIRAYRIRGHLIANLDPLSIQEKKEHPELKPETYGFKKKD